LPELEAERAGMVRARLDRCRAAAGA
jgi:hypothetical protein